MSGSSKDCRRSLLKDQVAHYCLSLFLVFCFEATRGTVFPLIGTRSLFYKFFVRMKGQLFEGGHFYQESFNLY